MSFAPKAEAKEAESANNDADETPRPPISAGRASTRNIVEIHVTHLGKPIGYGFVVRFQRNWMIKTCISSQEVQQLWQTDAIFQHNFQ